jgi:hypothetical protein
MTMSEKIDDLIRARIENSVTSLEFTMHLLRNLQELPLATREATLEVLSAHVREEVREAASECRLFMRHQELSWNLDYIRQNSPLRPGSRLELFGGYDYYSADGKPWWLNGRDCYRATFLSFASRGENTIPAGLVEFGEAVERPGHKGRYGVLLANYGTHSAAWIPAEDDVVVYVTEVPPEDVSPFRFDGRASPDPIETHATYRVVKPS